MENQLNKAGADKGYVIAPNNIYSEIAAAIGACMFAVANDRKAWVFADNSGAVFKTMQDSSGNGTIPVNSIVLADANGRATSNASFKFDGTGATMTFPLPFTLNFGGTAEGAKQIVISTNGVVFQKRVSGSWVESGAFI